MKKLLFFPLLLITCICFAQDAKKIIGKPIKIGNFLVAQNDFPEQINWEDAKKACRSLGKGWRLPTRAELNILYNNRKKIGGFILDNYYWSSTELDDESAFNQDFTDGNQSDGYKRYKEYVRAIKSI